MSLEEKYPFRPVGARVHLRRVQDRSSLIDGVGVRMGIDDSVLQVAEVIATGPEWQEKPWLREVGLKPGDIVVYNQARVYDHFRWHEADILVYPGQWVLGVVLDGVLVEHPELRRYEKQPI